MDRKLLPTLTTGLYFVCAAAVAASLTTAVTYQGRLNDGANPANGNYDLKFTVYDALTGGSIVGGPLTNTVSVSNGLFVAVVDFGNGVFTGTDRWLAIGVRATGGGPFSALSPRQPLTPAPHALYAPMAGTAASASAVTAGAITGAGIADGQVVRSSTPCTTR